MSDTLFETRLPYCSKVNVVKIPIIPSEIAMNKKSVIYKIIYIIDGECEFKCKGIHTLLKNGDVAILTPGDAYKTTPHTVVTVANVYFTFDENLSKH